MTEYRILVAEDDDDLRHGIETVLKVSGFVVFSAQDGERALALAIDTKPDLLVTDVMMPKMDGWTLVKALRSRAMFALTPVIFLTSLDSPDDALQGYTLGADDYIGKPCSLIALPQRVRDAIDRRSGLDALVDRTRQAAATPDGQPAVWGSLGQLGLPTVLNMLELERKSGHLVVARPTHAAAVFYLRAGRLVGGELTGGGPLKDRHLLFHVLSWTDGTFEFFPCQVDRQDAIGTPTTQLLMEAARRHDELRKAVLPARGSKSFPY